MAKSTHRVTLDVAVPQGIERVVGDQRAAWRSGRFLPA